MCGRTRNFAVQRSLWLVLAALIAALAELPVVAEAAAPPSTMIDIAAGGPPHAFAAAFFGANVVNANNVHGVPAWSDPNTAYWLKNLGITSLRFPGGAVANSWDWEAGAKCGRTGSDTLTDFAALAQATNTVASYVLDVMTALSHPGCSLSPAPANESQMISDQLAMLTDAGSLGLDGIKFLELGNEFYLKNSSYIVRFPCTQPDCAPGDYSEPDDNAGSVYAADMNNWIAAIRQSYPDSQIGAVIYAHGGGPYRTRNWNAGLLSGLQGADAIIFHDYTVVYDDGANGNAILSSVFENWRVLEQDLAAMGQTGISQAWITEWNFSDETAGQKFAGSWLSAMIDFQHLVNYLSEPLVTREMVWNLANPTASGSIVYFPGQQYTIGGVSYTIPDGQGMLSASGEAVALVGSALAGANATAPLIANGSPMISGRGYRPFTAVTGVFVVRGSQTELLLENFSARSLKVFYEPAGSQTAVVSIFAPSLATYVTPGTPVTTINSTSDGGVIVLPPYSINSAVIAGG